MTAVASANLGNLSDQIVYNGLKKLSQRVSVITTDESGDRRKVIERFCNNTGWEPWFGDGSPGAASVASMWNPFDVKVNRLGTRKSTEPTNCGPLGKGPNEVKAKVWNYMRVEPLVQHERHSTDPFALINGHFPASLYNRCRYRLGTQMVQDLTEMVEKREDYIDVVVLGDFNQRPTSAMLKPLRQMGMVQRVDFPTKDKRIIDHAWTLNRRGHATRFEPRYSDHWWVILDLW